MKKKVLIVDDSAVVRQALTRIIESDPGLEVIGTANDPRAAVRIIAEQKPDVITLDVEMPFMDGLTFLKRIMAQHPMAVVVISSLTAKGSENAMRAFELGAVEVIKKPTVSIERFEAQEQEILLAVHAAAKAVILRRVPAAETKTPEFAPQKMLGQTSDKVIAVGASTGGTEAILTFLRTMPLDCPGIVIVQHMPELFTRSFAERLDKVCAIRVKEATHGDSVLRGSALIAPGNRQMELMRSGARYQVRLFDGPPVNRHRPSVDVLFHSVAKVAARNATGVIMTGMGADGAQGLREMHDAGSVTLAQDEKTCVVFGMPKEAIRLGGVQRVLPLEILASHALLSQKYIGVY